MRLALRTKKGLGINAKINPSTLKRLGISNGEIVKVSEVIIGASFFVKISSQSGVADADIQVDADLLSIFGLLDDMEVEVERAKKASVAVKRVVFSVAPISRGETLDKIIPRLAYSQDKVKASLGDTILYRGAVYQLPAFGVTLQVQKIEPEIPHGTYLTVDWKRIEEISYVASKGAVLPFNALLIIDVSKSMLEELESGDFMSTLYGLRDQLSHSKTALKYLNSLIDTVKKSGRIRKVDACILAIASYLLEKIGRGYGESIGVITFSKDAQVLRLAGQEILSTSKKDIGQVVEYLIEQITHLVESGSETNMTSAFRLASEVIDRHDTGQSMWMVVLLTDGYPISENNVKRVIKEKFLSRKNMVLFSIGIGDVHKELLSLISSACRGDLHIATSGRELISWYSMLAKELAFRVHLKPVVIEVGRDEEVAESRMTKLDLVFVMDATGSMGPYIKETKKRINDMLKTYEEMLKGRKISFRVGVVAYRDHCDGRNILETMDLSTDIDKVRSFISRVRATGGGDYPEAVADGLSAATGLSWRQEAYKIITLIGDAPPHNYESGACKCDLNVYSVAKDLAQMNAMIFSLGIGNATDVAESFSRIAEIAHGSFHNLENYSELFKQIRTTIKSVSTIVRFDDQIEQFYKRRGGRFSIAECIDALGSEYKRLTGKQLTRAVVLQTLRRLRGFDRIGRIDHIR